MHRHLTLIAASLIANGVLAQTAAPADHGAHHPKAPTEAATASADFAEGEVRKVDKPAGKITLRHGEIKSLEMPAMTMVFMAARPEMLEQVKAGDKVRFRAANQGGAFVVTEIQPAK